MSHTFLAIIAGSQPSSFIAQDANVYFVGPDMESYRDAIAEVAEPWKKVKTLDLKKWLPYLQGVNLKKVVNFL